MKLSIEIQGYFKLINWYFLMSLLLLNFKLKSFSVNAWAYCDYVFSNLYSTHNLYGPRVNCIYFVNKRLKKTAYLLKEYIHIRKKNLFLSTSLFFLMKTGFILRYFGVIFPIQSSIGNTTLQYSASYVKYNFSFIYIKQGSWSSKTNGNFRHNYIAIYDIIAT